MVPETKTDIDLNRQTSKEPSKTKSSSIIVVAEGDDEGKCGMVHAKSENKIKDKNKESR